MTDNHHNNRGIVFRDPPQNRPHRARSKAREFVATLRQHPNRWAVWKENAKVTSTYVSLANYRRQYPDTEWCFVRETPDNPDICTIYCRVVSEEQGQ